MRAKSHKMSQWKIELYFLELRRESASFREEEFHGKRHPVGLHCVKHVHLTENDVAIVIPRGIEVR